MSAGMGQRAAALAANRGLAVFPIFALTDGRCDCGRVDCHSPGKHPVGSLVPQGCLEATTDVRAIKEWWSLYPEANIGIATGDASGVFVADIDVATGGEDTLNNLEERFGRLPATWAAETGSLGAHFYFRMPAMDVRNSAGAIGPGVDIRGTGGYVVAPPSLHASGRRYRWGPGCHPKEIGLADAPGWLIERLGPSDATATAQPLPTRIAEGYRNVWLASAAGTMRRRGFCEEAILAALLIENRKRCTPPLEEREVRRIARSIDRYKPEPELRARFNKANPA